MSTNVAVVMAGGKGTRMKSDLPKVLIPVLGRPMIEYVLDALEEAGVDRMFVVVGHRAELVQETLSHRRGLTYCLQAEQLGTGHAVMMCRERLADHDGPVLVVAGDSPMMQSSSIRGLFEAFHRDRPACILGTANKEDPQGLGRVVRDEQGRFIGIVEEKDATAEQRAITEVNLSCYLFDCSHLLRSLDQLNADNAQAEYYITDCPGILLREGHDVRALNILQACESLSINTPVELSIVEEALTEMRG